MINPSDISALPGFAPKTGQVPASPRSSSGRVKAPIKDSLDLQRILKIPKRLPPTDAQEDILRDVITSKYSRNRSKCNCSKFLPNVDNPCITRLGFTQAWALMEIETCGGLLGFIGVGHGKTLLNILSPLAMQDCKVALLLLPPTLVEQLVIEYMLIAEHFRVPHLVVHDPTNRTKRSDKSAPTLHVLPYSRLSLTGNSALLRKIKPDMIIGDECHKLRDKGTATVARVQRALDEFKARGVFWSGSVTDNSIKDFGHLAHWALGDNSPLPMDPQTLKDWAQVIDPSKSAPAPPGALFALCTPGQNILEAFSDRLLQTHGIIHTKKAPVDAELSVTERKAPPIPDVVEDAIRGIRDGWQRPDGEQFYEKREVVICARQAAAGFYYRWTYPRGEKVSAIERWFEVRKAWHSELREKLGPREEFLDSDKLCEQAADRFLSNYTGPLPVWKSDTWAEWCEVKNTVKPETETVWIDEYLARDAADWALTHNGIVWYLFTALGVKVSELTGLPLFAGGSGDSEEFKKENGNRSVIASIKAHGTGLNGLQRIFTKQLITSPPSSSMAWEQLLGRLHRLGQDKDFITAEVYRHTKEYRDATDEALRRCGYVETITKSKQKLVMSCGF